MVKSAKFQMTIHIDYDREENKIQFLMDSQTKMIRTLENCTIFDGENISFFNIPFQLTISFSQDWCTHVPT